MDYKNEKFGPSSLMKSNAQQEPMPVLIINTPQLSYGNVKVLSRPMGMNVPNQSGSWYLNIDLVQAID